MDFYKLHNLSSYQIHVCVFCCWGKQKQQQKQQDKNVSNSINTELGFIHSCELHLVSISVHPGFCFPIKLPEKNINVCLNLIALDNQSLFLFIRIIISITLTLPTYLKCPCTLSSHHHSYFPDCLPQWSYPVLRNCFISFLSPYHTPDTQYHLVFKDSFFYTFYDNFASFTHIKM